MVGRGERTDAERAEEAKWILRELGLAHTEGSDAAAIDEEDNCMQQQQPKRRVKAETSVAAGIQPAALREHSFKSAGIDKSTKARKRLRREDDESDLVSESCTTVTALVLHLGCLLILHELHVSLHERAYVTDGIHMQSVVVPAAIYEHDQ
jgi:hypothetical protein